LERSTQINTKLATKEAIAKFCLATKHDCLAKHFHHMEILQSPVAPMAMDFHHLLECSALLKITLTEKYREAGEIMYLS
jgi:hypothetical protein